ncbi:serine hydrolase domain-containing protein [Lentzea albida]|uniref:CubicO group peptidase, beta-lactamase class C family n=1 Tax=Lentzea albida TaxID=65499 RepID=A0A1H9XFP0_9PSEU|nr:serine hydrolase domain-containing protein [Lentzea albida]SES44483.1 CubicO group peptidase, beta-lactamase class C family [Lentzea albida]
MMTSDELQVRLAELAASTLVPGAAVAILRGEETVSAVTGVANMNTGAPVVANTLFASGSICKVFTASLIMTLVDDGLVELDAPVQRYLPDFTLADPVKSAAVTVRMLLSHTSGLPRNFFPDDPAGPDVIEKFMQRLKAVPFPGTPGKQWSYSNPGMVTLGRIAEVLTKQTYDDALDQRILRPLGLNATTYPDRMIMGSTAVGHLVDPATGDVTPAPLFRKWFGNAPAGSTLWLDVAALIGFARMHLDGGLGPDGHRVLSEESVAAMQTPLADIWGFLYPRWGLGWGIADVGDRRLVAHAGGNIGMQSTLWVIPDQHAAVAVLTNSGTGFGLNSTLAAEILEREFGLELPAPPSPPDAPESVDPSLYVGRYGSVEGDLVVTCDANGSLYVQVEPEASQVDAGRLMGGPTEPSRFPMTCVDAERSRFLVAAGPEGSPLASMPMEFYEADSAGCPRVANLLFLAERVG